MQNISVGQFFVFDLMDNKLKQISIAFDTLEEGKDFIETMKRGMYYKTIYPNAKLIVMEVKYEI